LSGEPSQKCLGRMSNAALHSLLRARCKSLGCNVGFAPGAWKHGAGAARWTENSGRKIGLVWEAMGGGTALGVEADGDVMTGGRPTGGRPLGKAGGAGTKDGGGGAATTAAETKHCREGGGRGAETKDWVAGVAGSI
jgi:hypothetical protein